MKVVRFSVLCAPAFFTPQKIIVVLISVRGRPQGRSSAAMIRSMKNSNDNIGNRTRDLLVCATEYKKKKSKKYQYYKIIEYSTFIS
jgi:hypothetical protein